LTTLIKGTKEKIALAKENNKILDDELQIALQTDERVRR
jgi:hypothetical protein